MQSFGQIMFTEAVRAEQTRDGSRRQNERMAASVRFPEIGLDEREFIETRTTAYLASVNEDGWPYVQHRGGPAGFLKVLGPDRLAFADYPGNRQYVSLGNLAGDDRVSMILMDYPRRARLKILARAETSTAPELLAALIAPKGITPTRAIVLRVAALDWNCPKYITGRFAEPEIAALVGPKMQEMADRIAELEAALAERGGAGS